jgi:hypothetical protein
LQAFVFYRRTLRLREPLLAACFQSFSCDVVGNDSVAAGDDAQLI